MSSSENRETLRLHPAYAILPMNAGVQLRAGDEEIHLLEGDDPEFLSALLLRVLKPFDPETIVAEFPTQAAAQVKQVLAELKRARLLISGTEFEQEDQRYWSHYGLSESKFSSSVLVCGESELANLLVGVLAEHQVTAFPWSASWNDTPEVSTMLCAWEQPDLTFVSTVNAAAIERRLPLLFVDLSHGRHATLGPFFIPGEGSCYACYRQRWRGNAASFAEMEVAHTSMVQNRESLPAFGTLPAFRHWLAGMAAAELLAFLRGHRALRTLNRAITVDLEGLKTWSEPVWRVPWCAACGVAP